MKRVMDRRQRACQIWGSSRLKKWIARAGRRCEGGSGIRRWQRLVRWGEQSQARRVVPERARGRFGLRDAAAMRECFGKTKRTGRRARGG